MKPVFFPIVFAPGFTRHSEILFGKWHSLSLCSPDGDGYGIPSGIADGFVKLTGFTPKSRYIACLSGLHPHPLGLEWARLNQSQKRRKSPKPPA